MWKFLFGRNAERLLDAIDSPWERAWASLGFGIFGAVILVGHVVALIVWAVAATSYLHHDFHQGRTTLLVGGGIEGLVLAYQWFIRYGLKKILRKAGFSPV